jgi:hypothetical protein
VGLGNTFILNVFLSETLDPSGNVPVTSTTSFQWLD